MQRAHLWLLLIIIEVFAISPSFLAMTRAAPLSGIGIGIREEGPVEANVGDTIAYSVTVYNLGDYWIRFAVVTDKFPNGTSSSWNAPDLAPMGQLGDSFDISGILYSIKNKDVISGSPPYVINHAEAVGYAVSQGLNVSVYAETNYVTILPLPVGGYSISMEIKGTSTPTTIYTTLLFVTIAIFCMPSLFRRKACRVRKTAAEAAH